VLILYASSYSSYVFTWICSSIRMNDYIFNSYHVQLAELVNSLPKKLVVLVTHHHHDHVDGMVTNVLSSTSSIAICSYLVIEISSWKIETCVAL
jgi:hypothetical protein